MASSQPPLPTTSPKVPTQSIKMAVNALLKWKSELSSTQKPNLLPTDEFLYLVLTLVKIPSKSRVNAHKIPLPHPLYDPETSEFCLFVHDSNSKLAKSKVADEGLPVSEIIKLTKLKKNYKAHEQKRKLCDSFDVFFADKKVVPLLPNAIGGGFYKKKKIPVPVELGRGNWKEQIERVCSSGLLYLSTGTCCVVKVAKASMGKDEIVENVVAAVEGVANVVPKKWGNVRSFHVKFADSLALPVYQKVPDVGLKIAGGFEEKAARKVIESRSEEKGRKRKIKGRYMDEEKLIGEDESGGESEGEEEVVNEVEVEEEKVVGKKRKAGGAAPVKKAKKGEKVVKKLDKGLSGKKLKKSKVLV